MERFFVAMDNELRDKGTNNVPLIVCPHCGAEYMPGEILVEDGILGDVHDIVRTSKGHIEHCLGKPYDLQETYICDYCNREFRVTGTMSFSTSTVDGFDEEYEKVLYTDRIPLEEN